MMRIVFGIVAGVATMALLNTGAGLANEQTSKKDATEAGMQMMQGAGVTEEARKATRMMEMMGGQSGGMGEMMGGMSQPDAPQPGK